MGANLSELDKVFIKQGHRKFAESNTVCRCGGLLKAISYFYEPWGATNLMQADGEKARRAMMVCEDCGALYAMPTVIERGA